MFDIIKVACLLLSALAPPLPAAPPLAGDGVPSTSCAFVELEFFAFFGSGSTPTRKAASESLVSLGHRFFGVCLADTARLGLKMAQNSTHGKFT